MPITGLKQHQGRFNRMADDMRSENTSRFKSSMISLWLSATGKERAEILLMIIGMFGNRLSKLFEPDEEQAEEIKQVIEELKTPVNELTNLKEVFANIKTRESENAIGV